MYIQDSFPACVCSFPGVKEHRLSANFGSYLYHLQFTSCLQCISIRIAVHAHTQKDVYTIVLSGGSLDYPLFYQYLIKQRLHIPLDLILSITFLAKTTYNN